jgi:uroporphyrinogen decarboxylase
MKMAPNVPNLPEDIEKGGKPPMRPKDRFLAALKRQPVDRVPIFDFLFQRPLFQELIGRTPDAYNARDAMDLTVAMGLDGVWIPYGCFSGWSPEKLTECVYKDEWGTTFQQDPASWPIDAPIAFPLKSREGLRHYTPPDPMAEGRLDEINVAVKMNEALGDKSVAILGGVTGPLTVSWFLTGYENICMSIYDDPEFLHELVEIAVEFAVKAINRMAKVGIDAMILSDDYGASAQGLLRPQQFKEIYKPGLKRIIDCIKANNLPVFLHCCGRVYDYLDDLVEIGIEAYHPVQRTAGMDLAKVKAKYGDRICLVGNIDSSRTLPFGTPEEIEAETREALRVAAPGYGYILASDHSLHDGIPVKNIQLMFDVARKHGVYSKEDQAA